MSKLRPLLWRKMFKQSSAGFSLIEILVALTLLGLAGTFVVGRIFQSLHEGKVRAAQIQMQSLSKLLKDYRRHCGAYPTTEQGLEALKTQPSSGRECRRYQPGGYLEGDIPLDPWDYEYIYSSDGKTFNIVSYGTDNEEGGDGEDADISLNRQESS